MLSLLFFILALFLMDVNLNLISAAGLNTIVPVYGNTVVKASSMVWLGFLLALLFFFIISFRSLYKRKQHLTKWDILFGTIGIIGLMITLSGGLLLFTNQIDLVIPFFSYNIPRVLYYHTGIGLDLIAVIYFALTKN